MEARSFLLLLLPLLALPAVAEPPPIPVAQLFANPTVKQPRLSPNGARLAAVYSDGDDQLVVVRPTAGGALKPIAEATHDEMRLGWIRWANDETLLLSGSMRNRRGVGARSRATQLFSIPATGGRLTWLGRRWSDPVQFQDRIVHNLPDEPGYVLVSYRKPSKDVASIRRMNVETGALRSYQASRRRVFNWFLDADAVVRAGSGVMKSGEYFAVARASAQEGFHETIGPSVAGEGGRPRVVGVSSDPNILYVVTLHEGRDALYEWDIRENALGRKVFSHGRVDVGDLFLSDDKRSLLGVRYVDDVPKVHWLDRDYRRMFRNIARSLRKSLGSQVQIHPASETRDQAIRLFRVEGPTQPPVYYAYEEAVRGLGPILESLPGMDKDRLSSMQAVEYAARDGLTIPAYLTLPKDHPEKGIPVIVMPHGGPWSRDWMRWDPEIQLFASRGYAVFQPNFRGSTGFGGEFLAAGYREWGFAIQDDITDGVKWLIEQGVADPERIGIYGASFGGYASLMGLVKTPDLYRAGAGYAGVYDIPSFIAKDQWYSWDFDDWHDVRIGTDPERLKTGSPLRRAAEIRAPVLLAHGEDDSRVHPDQSRDMHEALEDAGKDVEYLEFENEIHGFLFERNRIQFYTSLVEFFDEHLAPRAAEDAEPEAAAGAAAGG